MARNSARFGLLAGIVAGLATHAANAAPVTQYRLLTTMAIPASSVNSQGGRMTSFDISFVDATTGNYYFADRSNAGVDIFSGATNTFLGRAGGFTGQAATTSISGPDGVVVVNNAGAVTLYAGDGNSTLRAFNVANPATPVALGTVNTGGGTFRVDEMAYSPTTKSLFVANNANAPAYASLINTSNPSAPTLARSNLLVPNQVASGGLEQSVWDSSTQTFFVSVPTFNGTDAGGVEEFDTSGNALRRYDFTSFGIAACASAGLGLGASGNLMVGCGTARTQTVVLNPSGTGSIVARLGAISGSDELWYDPASNDYFVTGVASNGDRLIDIFSDTDYALLQSIDLTTLGAGLSNLHSVAVDPLNGEIFVPLTGTTAAFTNVLCPNGCVAVFAQQALVPEPGTVPLMAIALMGLIAASTRSHGRVADRRVGRPSS